MAPADQGLPPPVGSSPGAVAQDYEALLQFMYLVPIGLLQCGNDGAISMINPLCANLLLPVAPEGELSNLFDALACVAPDLRHRVAHFDRTHGIVCENHRVQLLPARPGHPDPQMLDITLVRIDPSSLMAVLTDATQAFRRERQLRRHEAWFNALLSEATDYALVKLDAAGRIERWNASVGRVTGFDAGQVQGRAIEVFFPADGITPDRIQDRLAEADASGWSLEHSRLRRSDGTAFWGNTLISTLDEDARVLPHPDGAHCGYALILREVTQQGQSMDSHHRDSLRDHLTGVANRRAFFEAAEIELERWRQRPRPMCLLMIDADHFKQVNDVHGHPVGDEVLRELAARLQQTVRNIDLVARIGGEEFAVLLPSVDAGAAQQMAERLRAAVADRGMATLAGELLCTVSIGMAVFSDRTRDLAGWLRQADTALYRAKHAGRNRVALARPER